VNSTQIGAFRPPVVSSQWSVITAWRTAARWNMRTTKLYDRTTDQVSLDGPQHGGSPRYRGIRGLRGFS